jgi:wyosine [tRNA(Phe)-imidazoG37] synthetase (radical SAM superfamily)
MQHHVFGPVPSRRLGRSLGVDLVPFKTCTFDCIYCQLGRTTCHSVERQEWAPTNAVLDELKRKLACRPDYITLSGSGEPTLHSALGEIIEHIQALTDVPVAVLTNGSLLWQPQVRAELAQADVVLPSLDAGDAAKFDFINRPHPSLAFGQVIEGLIEFRREFTGRYWLEVFLLAGYTAILADVDRLAALVKKIRPDRVQLNTVARPPAEEFALGVAPEELARLARRFSPRAEVVAERPSRLAHKSRKPDARAVLELLRRRPCTAGDLARGLGVNRLEILKRLEALVGRGEIETSRHEGENYYRAGASASGHPAEAASRAKKP